MAAGVGHPVPPRMPRRSVVSGELDRISACGIDKWLGGVHLTEGNLWRWDGDRGEIIPSRPAAS